MSDELTPEQRAAIDPEGLDHAASLVHQLLDVFGHRSGDRDGDATLYYANLELVGDYINTTPNGAATVINGLSHIAAMCLIAVMQDDEDGATGLPENRLDMLHSAVSACRNGNWASGHR